MIDLKKVKINKWFDFYIHNSTLINGIINII